MPRGEAAAAVGMTAQRASHVLVEALGNADRKRPDRWTQKVCRFCRKPFRVLKSNLRKRWRASYGEQLVPAHHYCSRACYDDDRRKR